MTTAGRVRLASILFVLGCVSACADDGRSNGSHPTSPTGPMDMSNPPPVLVPVVYGHSASMLYTVDPDTLAVQPVGNFIWPNGDDEMTDIALDRDGNMVGISYQAVYSVDKTTAKCTYLAPFQGRDFNGLSFIYANLADGGEEILVGADASGSVYKIDPMTGTQSKLGSYGSGWGSSGDIVSVQGATYATVKSAFDASDTLVKLDPNTGHATAIGKTGVAGIWGLGYWKQRLFGFTKTSGLVLIDVNTGVATAVSGGNVSWYGAGVTTAAPTTVQ